MNVTGPFLLEINLDGSNLLIFQNRMDEILL